MSLAVVIPAYNEEERIGAALEALTAILGTWPAKAELIVVDDGSRDATRATVETFAERHPFVTLLSNPRNLGKGASVKRGMLSAHADFRFFMDADLSVPVDALVPAVTAMVGGSHAVLIGSRRATGARIVERQPWARESLGHVFTFMARAVLCPDIVDFTCGFKGFRRDAAELIFTLQRRLDWAFDAEILYLARLAGIPVHQFPVRWSHREGSRVRFPHDAWHSFLGLLDVRLRVPQAVRAGGCLSRPPAGTA